MSKGRRSIKFAGKNFSSLLAKMKRSGDPPGLPLYVYYVTSTDETALIMIFRSGQNGIWEMILEDLLATTGSMTFNAAAQWDDGGIQRSGWIYTNGGGGLQPSTMFVADFSGESGYEMYETTLPYTPGQPPAVIGEIDWVQRLTLG